MARKKKEKEKKDLDDEKADSTGSDEEEIGQESADKAQEDVPGPEEKVEKPRASLIRRLWIPGLLIFIFFAAGIAVFLKPDLLDSIKGKEKPDYSIDLSNDNLQEEDLSPFFIPSPDGSSRGAVRVDLSVIWDGVASVRYKANELKVRAEVYDYLVGVDGEITDPDELKKMIEEGITDIFRKSLAIKDLAIRIKELRII